MSLSVVCVDFSYNKQQNIVKTLLQEKVYEKILVQMCNGKEENQLQIGRI